ncbi:MAG: hypothetical protein BGO47_02575 [Microbacterium sp. 67-17]|nr:MAG: hypothetical protein BGO47_02575 [Microbacterium sp. 67-17]
MDMDVVTPCQVAGLAGLTGNIVLVAGGSSGARQAGAEVCAAVGATVVVAGRDGEQACAVVDGIRAASHGPYGDVVDVADRGMIDQIIDRVIAEVGTLAVVVANAGIAGGPSIDRGVARRSAVSYAYVVTKAAIFNFVLQVALELASRGIRVDDCTGTIHRHPDWATARPISPRQPSASGSMRSCRSPRGR